jgi:hypothetical protein
MGNGRLSAIACFVAGYVVVTLLPATALAWWPNQHPWQDNPANGYAVPIQVVYQFPAAIVNQPLWGYAYPNQSLYDQFPAAPVPLPGSYVSFLDTDLAAGLLGGRPYLYHH